MSALKISGRHNTIISDAGANHRADCVICRCHTDVCLPAYTDVWGRVGYVQFAKDAVWIRFSWKAAKSSSYASNNTLVWLRYYLSRRPIARLFDILMDRFENQMENRAIGAHNRTIVCDFEESDRIWHVRINRMNRIQLAISNVARNAWREK